MRASHSWLNNLCAISIVCMLVVGIAAAHPVDREDKGKKAEDGKSKIAPTLKEKIKGAKAVEELPLIIFFKKKGKTEFSRTKAQNAVVSAVKSNNGKVKHRYSLIDAVSAKMPAGKIAKLAESGDIDRIYYDEVYQIPLPPEQNDSIKLDVSTQAIGANYVWDTLGFTGSGITVAIIDTGIDYTHSDLGGGWGNRVVGGYDFYNDDSDPMDDNGHGTHVAGTVGANGTLKGVAPDANLFALKVCSASGSCPTSDQIAGIDWAVANDADVISLSIGGNAQPNDEFVSPSGIIADAAVDAGVVVVIAAGNEGPGTGTTASPGAAKKVITVGASDDKGTLDISGDTIAIFSNRGPSAFGRLDPDVVAPGVNICSSRWDNYQPSRKCIDNKHIYISGTSMATPHVSGAAALLLESSPNLTPAEVRSTLMHSATKLTSGSPHVFEQGAGIINITKAITYEIEASINGDDRWEESIIPGFTAITELTLSNNNTSSVNFTFTFESMTGLEGDNNLSTSNFALPDFVVVGPNSTETVKINFSAPNNATPSIYGTILMITGNNSEELRIPIVITIPLFESGVIQGTVDDDILTSGPPSYVIYEWGDWIYYKIKSHNGTSMTATLSWVGSDDLDLYLFAPNGEEVDHGWYSNPEQVTVSNMAYDEYWLAVHAWDLSGTRDYSLTVSYDSGLRVSPSSWQGIVAEGGVKNITFTITNDAVAKSALNLSVNFLQDGADFFAAQSVGSGYTRVWSRVENGTNTTYTRYLNATLRWNDASNNLDLYFAYENKSDSNWYLTRFKSEHWSDASTEPIEELKFIDIQHYLKTYPDVGIYVSNTGGVTVTMNLTLNLTDVSPWSAASVNESTISLSSSQVKQVNATINGPTLEAGKTYDAVFTIKNVTEDFAVVPIRLTINPPPIITVISPENITYATENIPLNVSAEDIDTWWYDTWWYEYNGNNITFTPNTTFVAGGGDGPKNITVYANSTAGYIVSSTAYFTVDTRPPEINITNPVDGKTISVFNNTIRGNVSDIVSIIHKVNITGNGTGTVEVDVRNGEFSYDIFYVNGSNTIVVNATDEVGNTGSANVTVTVIKELHLDVNTTNINGTVSSNTTINIIPEWNLVGYPTLDTRDITDVLSTINYTVVFAYINGGWKKSTSSRNPMTEMIPGYGYWINATDAGSYEVSNSEPTTFNVPLIQGWNLISIPLEQDDWSITSVLASIEGNYTVVFAYINGGWKKSTSSRNPLTEMGLEHGYWINMSAPDTLEINGSEINGTFGWAINASYLDTYINLSTGNRSVKGAMNITAHAFAADAGACVFDVNAGSWTGHLGRFLEINVSDNLNETITWVEIRTYYLEEEVEAAKLTEDSLALYWCNGTTWKKLDVGWDWVYTTSINSTDAAGGYSGYVWANLSRFGAYSVAGLYRADLTLNSSDITFSNSSPTDGDSVTINATVHNTNATDASNFTVELLVNGVSKANNTLSVKNNSTNTTQFNWTSIQGTHNITIVADVDNAINESNETNNNATEEITVQAQPGPPLDGNTILGEDKADLTVDNITFSDSSPTEGDLITINATVHNNGETDATGFKVSFLIDGTEQENNTLSVEANSVNTTLFTWTSIQGTHNITIVADVDNAINESNETNNNATEEITVQAKPSAPSGGGGGGGGGSIKGVVIKKIDANSSGTAIFDIRDTGYISEITIYSKQTVYNVRVVAEAVAKKPFPTMPEPEGMVLSYLKLTKSGISNAQFEKAEIKFQVPLSWLKDNNIAQNSVFLKRDVLTTWETIETQYLSEDADYAYFSAITPGFSYFVITGDEGSGYVEEKLVETKISAPPTTTLAPITPSPMTPVPTTPPPTTPAPAPVLPPNIKNIIPWIVIILIIAVATYYWYIKKKIE